MDQAITRWINALAGSNVLLDSFMIAATQFVAPLLVLLVALQWCSRRERVHVRHTCVAAGLLLPDWTWAQSDHFLYVHRIRPYDAGVSHLIISRSGDWSFPSDHATATFAIAASFLLHGIRKRALGFLAGALLVCTPRVYVGTHYVTDVLGGVVTGIIAAAAVHSLYREGTRAGASSPKSCRLGKSKNLVGTISRAHDDGVSQRRG